MSISNELLFDTMMILLFATAFLGVATWVLIFTLSFYFNKFDKTLLKAPYFNEAEQDNYKEFPLNQFKTLIYISLFSFRKLTGKRFKGATIPKPDMSVTLLSYTASIMAFITMIFGTLMFTIMFMI